MLEGIFGNKTAEKVLLYIFHYKSAYPSAIAKDLSIARHPVMNQLDRFEKAGVLISEEIGRARVYRFNEKSPRTNPVRTLIQQVYDMLSLAEKQKLFKERRRPRQKGKPVMRRS